MGDDKIIKPNTREVIDSFEDRFQIMSKELERKRRIRNEQRGYDKDDASAAVSGDVIAVYKSKTAVAKYNAKPRAEGVVRRTIRLVKGLKEAKKTADALPGCSAENRRELYSAVYRDAWAPVANGIDNAADTLWGFLSGLGYDLLEIIVFIANIIIKIFYYAGSAAIFVWDKIWDFRLWLDVHKKTAMQLFSSAVVVIAIGLIAISSMSAYEYSYYGRKLGITKSKREVYDVIEALGDKLSESSGANISLDVERDIVFERVYGFGLDIDSEDDILNTITYMKDIRVQAYGIFINGNQVVVVDNENTANNIIQRVKDYFTPTTPGYEYTSVSFGEEVLVQEVTAKLAELWNPLSAVRYIETGTTNVLKEGDTANPKVTVYASATVAEDIEIPYGTRYVKNSNLYISEVVPVSEGIPGITRVTSLIQMENGVEVSKVEQSSIIVSNPVDEVYEQGTKPLPERAGTGTWIFPLRGSYTITSRFGRRYTGIAGASTDHKGVDLYQAPGSKIYAADGGVVTWAGWNNSMGNYVVIDHGGLYETVYAHCSKLLVTVGQTVAQGQVVGLIGQSGIASGPHLHFEVHFNGVAFDPLTLYQ